MSDFDPALVERINAAIRSVDIRFGPNALTILTAGGAVPLSQGESWFMALAAADELFGEEERDRAMAGVPLVCSDDRHQAKVRGLEAELAGLREERDEDTRVMQALRRQRDQAEAEVRGLEETAAERQQNAQHWQERAGAAEAERDQLDFLRAAVGLIRRADISSDEILFGLDGQQIRIAVIVSDTFAWGSADAEDITSERLPVLEQAWLDCKAVDAEEWTVELFAARVRSMRPQGAAYPKEAAIAALFDACGPEREVGLGNPRKPPVPVEGAP